MQLFKDIATIRPDRPIADTISPQGECNDNGGKGHWNYFLIADTISPQGECNDHCHLALGGHRHRYHCRHHLPARGMQHAGSYQIFRWKVNCRHHLPARGMQLPAPPSNCVPALPIADTISPQGECNRSTHRRCHLHWWLQTPSPRKGNATNVSNIPSFDFLSFYCRHHLPARGMQQGTDIIKGFNPDIADTISPQGECNA